MSIWIAIKQMVILSCGQIISKKKKGKNTIKNKKIVLYRKQMQKRHVFTRHFVFLAQLLMIITSDDDC